MTEQTSPEPCIAREPIANPWAAFWCGLNAALGACWALVWGAYLPVVLRAEVADPSAVTVVAFLFGTGVLWLGSSVLAMTSLAAQTKRRG